MNKYILTILFIFGVLNFKFVMAQELKLNPEVPLNLNPVDAVTGAGIRTLNTGQILNNRFQFNLPSSWEKININTNIPVNPQIKESQALPAIDLKQFLTPKNISSSDFGQAIKAIAVLVIEIFLVVISVVSQILKLVLGFLR